MKKIQYYSIRIFSGFIGFLPFFILYGLSDFITFILHFVVKYRRKVVRSNLTRCFPEKSKKELRIIERKFYRNLSDIAIESIKGIHMSKKQINNRFKIVNPEALDKYYQNGQDILSLAGHYCNWEWGILGVDFQIKHQAVSIYKPMNNKYMEKYSHKRRSRCGMKLIPISEAKNFIGSKRETPAALILAADQNPADRKKAIVVDFFGMETACLHGPEAYGRNLGWPIIYFDIQRVKRGHYTLEIIELFEHSGKTEFGEITQKYMSTLEGIIKQKPENWLWSHKRWKNTKEEIKEIKGYNQARIKKEKEMQKASTTIPPNDRK
ncbi:MAG: lysophospholipid acyltransferase family protein [Salinivirgaceae bacterium]